MQDKLMFVGYWISIIGSLLFFGKAIFICIGWRVMINKPLYRIAEKMGNIAMALTMQVLKQIGFSIACLIIAYILY